MPIRTLRRITPFLILFLGFFFGARPALATHNRAGEISVEQVGDCTSSLTVRATIVTYTKASSVDADRDTLTICWGDGFCQRVVRANGPGNPPQGEVLENNTKRNLYYATHTYPARGTYVISMTDPNRNGGILNVNFPNSEQIKFHLQTTYTFPNPQFQGCNNTPVLLQPPIDIGCVGQRFIHNPNAYDQDGDSLSYEFIVPMQDVGLDVPNYQFPDAINPGPDNQLTIDPVTGDIVWDAPQRAGEYNLAMIIIEWRNGFPLDTIIRDMQILIQDCDNRPPEIETPFEEICVIAGDTLEFAVTATAPLDEAAQRVRLTALGGPFEEDFSPATFEVETNAFEEDPVTKIFRWVPSCESISEQYYSVVFKALDNFFGNDQGLSTLKTVRIKVVGPPPKDVRAEAGNGFIDVTWEMPYLCENAADNYFQGFTVWRSNTSIAFPPDTCRTGLEGRGYEKLTPFSLIEMSDGRYFFRDETTEQGQTYCYRIVAEFAKTTPGGRFAYNLVESLPSDEACIQLNRDVPLMLKADVRVTDPDNGVVEICWSKPKAEDLDTLANPGPYVYEILRAPGLSPTDGDFLPIGVSFTQPTFAGANDICYTDTGLNTLASPYSYRINFYTGGNAEPLGASNNASTVRLTIAPTDEANVLSWQATVPWNNTRFVVYRQNDQGLFDSIATTNQATYRDRGLVNGENYCYRIQAFGSYGVPDLPSPLVNFSQEACAVPMDDVPPCAPIVMVDNICSTNTGCGDPATLFNSLVWTNPNEVCDDTDDVAAYRIYFTPQEGGNLEWIATIDGAANTAFDHQPPSGLAGCYAVTAVDFNGNESVLSNIFCVDNCPFYNLPNAFTPNNDGQNDLFVPYPFCFIDEVEFQVFNRWGQLVFETSDPNLNWDGTNLNGQALNDGVYYYVCRIFEQRVTGVVEQEELLKGYIQLIRGNN